MNKPLLLSIDVEDLLERFSLDKRPPYPSHVKECLDKLFTLFRKHNIKITCFVCGDLARSLPEVVRKIESEGHELACHSNIHTPLDLLNPKSFKDDLKSNIQSLRDAGAKGKILGFRAPIFSLTEKTIWAYDVLSELGFQYSSSVLPANNPQYGWLEFGSQPKKIRGIIELPMSIENFFGVKVPIGGMYLKWLPLSFITNSIKNRVKSEAFLSFIHPYDLDAAQEYFNHPGINNIIFHALLKLRRKQTIPRLEKILKLNLPSNTYKEYINTLSFNE